MSDSLKILALSGSLRKGSYNTALLHAAAELAPAGVTVWVFDLGEIPLYNDDVRTQGYPAPVEALRLAVADADALLISTPEYNRSFSGVIKNALDWVSRPPAPPAIGKVASVIGAGPGVLGTALANYQLRQVLSIMSCHVLPGGEVLVGGAGSKFDAEGRLTDEGTRKFLGEHLAKLAELARRLK